jgi:predicted amino acid-binding ACT domain protein
MSKATLTLKRLCFTGPEKLDACLDFHEGLNIVYGASDTGKSFILESLDFMLGGGEALRDLPERVGYDRIWLTIARPDKTAFTLTRSTEGGDFNLYEGSHHATPEGIAATTLRAKHDANKDDNISTYLLDQIGLSKKRIKKKADGATISFTLPYLRHLCIVSETDIQKPKSPITSGQFTQVTAEMSAFKLLLTGVDDSAIIKSIVNSPALQSREAKIEVIDELIISYQTRYTDLVDDVLDGGELTDQLQRLEETITLEQTQLNLTETQYRELSTQRISLRSTIEKSRERRAEIREMLQRFALLKEHYGSDIARLEGIGEAGSLVAAIAPGNCPLCGSETINSHPDIACDANLEVVVVAANAEKSKIERLRTELTATMQKLELEAQSFDRIIPRTQQDLTTLETKIADVAPSVMEQRTSYQTLVEKRASVRSLTSVWDELQQLKGRKAALEGVSVSQAAEAVPVSDLSTTVLDSFSQLLQSILKEWHFPHAERVYFDPQKRDFVIAGKARGSRGKGMRAITHAAFTISMLEYCKRESHPHLGFVVMDSPLLAYREPDIADDGVAETGLNEQFFSYLSKWNDRQAIIIENVDPPVRFTQEEYSTYFSGNPGIGRAGFFPSPLVNKE